MANEFIPVAMAQLWQVTLLILVVAALSRWISPKRPHLSHLLWLVVLIKCVTPPLWASPGGVFCWLQPEQQTDTPFAENIEWTPVAWDELLEVENASTMDSGVSDVPFAGVYLDESAEAELTAGSSVAEPPIDQPPGDRIGNAALVAWAMISGFVLIGVTVRWLRFWILVRESPRRDSPELDTMLQTLSKQLGVRRRVRLIVTESLVGPAVVGFFRVTVLIPAVVADKLKGESVAPILAHELLHVRRGDLWVGLLQTVAQALWWFHPLVWWVGRVTSRETERCCDEEVLGELKCDPASYARALLDVLDLKSQLKPVPVFPGVRPVDVTSQRLERIMTLRQGCRRRSPWWCWLVAIGAAALTLPGAAFEVSADAPIESSAHAHPPVLESQGTSKSPEASKGDDEKINRQSNGDTKSSRADNPDTVNPAATGSSGATKADEKPTEAESKPQSGAATSAASLHSGRLVFRHGGCHLEAVPREGSELNVAIDSDELTVMKAPLTLLLTRTNGFGFTRPIQMQAEQCRISQGDSLKIELSGNVLLTAPQQLIRANADSLLMTIPATGNAEADDGIKCVMKNVAMTMKLDPAKDSSLLRAEEVRIELDAETFKTAEFSASKVESLRVSDGKQSAAVSNSHSAEFSGDGKLLSQWDTIRRRRSLQKLVSPKFDRTPLKEAVAWFRTAGDLNIILDELAIEDEGVIGTTPVTLELKEVAIHSALRLLLKPLNLGITIDEESNVVVVTSQLNMRGKMIAAAYPVADLVIPIPKSVVVNLLDDRTGTAQSTTQTDFDELRLISGFVQDHPQLDFDSICELITTVVEPDSWQEVGGRGTLRTNETTLSLVIRQTREVHKEIGHLLDQLRRQRDVQVTLQMQTLSIPKSFFAEWDSNLKLKPLSESTTHSYMRLSSAQADELRNAGRSSQSPKVTLFNGQLCELRIDERNGRKQNWHVQPVVSGDRRSVRLGVGIDNGRSGTSDETVPTSVTTVSDGEAILVEVNGSAEGRIVGEPIPGQPRAFRQVSHPRRFVLIQPEVIIVDEEEELLGIDLEK